jgi:hypothetical protein
MGVRGYVPGQEYAPPHYLGAFYEGPIDSRQYKGFRELSEYEYRRYVYDAATVLEFFSDYEQYVMVRYAYVEYLHLLERQAAALANHVHLSEVMREQIVHNINRRLRSFFSEFRVFLDYTETKLKRRYGADSEQVNVFKTACSRQFDNSFAYRFVYKLRNYALHVNLPLNALSLTSGEGEFDAENPDTQSTRRKSEQERVAGGRVRLGKAREAGIGELAPELRVESHYKRGDVLHGKDTRRASSRQACRGKAGSSARRRIGQPRARASSSLRAALRWTE